MVFCMLIQVPHHNIFRHTFLLTNKVWILQVFFLFSEWHSHSESKLGMNAGVSWVLRHCYMVLSRYYL